jgi:hypothetical protein
MKKFIFFIISFAFLYHMNAQNNNSSTPRFPWYNFPNEKPTAESFWRVYRAGAEMELKLYRNKYPNLTFDNMIDYLYDPEIATFYYGIMIDYKTYLNDPRHPAL